MKIPRRALTLLLTIPIPLTVYGQQYSQPSCCPQPSAVQCATAVAQPLVSMQPVETIVDSSPITGSYPSVEVEAGERIIWTQPIEECQPVSAASAPSTPQLTEMYSSMTVMDGVAEFEPSKMNIQMTGQIVALQEEVEQLEEKVAANQAALDKSKQLVTSQKAESEKRLKEFMQQSQATAEAKKAFEKSDAQLKKATAQLAQLKKANVKAREQAAAAKQVAEEQRKLAAENAAKAEKVAKQQANQLEAVKKQADVAKQQADQAAKALADSKKAQEAAQAEAEAALAKAKKAGESGKLKQQLQQAKQAVEKADKEKKAAEKLANNSKQQLQKARKQNNNLKKQLEQMKKKLEEAQKQKAGKQEASTPDSDA